VLCAKWIPALVPFKISLKLKLLSPGRNASLSKWTSGWLWFLSFVSSDLTQMNIYHGF